FGHPLLSGGPVGTGRSPGRPREALHPLSEARPRRGRFRAEVQRTRAPQSAGGAAGTLAVGPARPRGGAGCCRVAAGAGAAVEAAAVRRPDPLGWRGVTSGGRRHRTGQSSAWARLTCSFWRTFDVPLVRRPRGTGPGRLAGRGPKEGQGPRPEG